jgi:hypothetical protein
MTVRERDRLDLVVAGGEVAVPEQGQFLAEWVGPAGNAIEPADLERSKKATWRMASSVVNWRDWRRRTMLASGPASRSRSSSVQVAPKPARTCRWATLRRYQGSCGVGIAGPGGCVF